MTAGAPRRLEDFLSAAARTAPDATAVVLDDQRLSFGELDELSSRLAGALVALAGCRPGDRVALVCGKTPLALVAIHAALKAGCAYVPVDPDSPPARSVRLLRASEPRAVICDGAGVERWRAARATAAAQHTVGAQAAPGASEGTFAKAVTVALTEDADCDIGPDTWHRQPPFLLPSAARAHAEVAQILFTSGSTGEPKGVQVTHRSALAFVEWAVGHFGIEPGERLSGHPPLHFDLSTFDIFGAMHARAELHLVPARLNVDAHGLAAFIRERELTQWFSVPSALTFMTRFEAIRSGDFRSLRRLLWCGEVLPTPVLRNLMERLPHVRFTNLYGPTEATIASSYFDVPRIPPSDDEQIPIGRPCPGEELLIVGEDGRELGVDEVGEIWIAGVGLSPGYWRDPARTRAAFVPHPRDPARRCYRTGDLGRRDRAGLFYFHGRRDSQIKHRGYRIELGEIEHALNKLPGVRECAVVGVPTSGIEGTAICAVWSRRPGADTDAIALRRALAEALPRYMLPTRWLELPDLPKNVNGKIDRRGLRERFLEELAGPASDPERHEGDDARA